MFDGWNPRRCGPRSASFLRAPNSIECRGFRPAPERGFGELSPCNTYCEVPGVEIPADVSKRFLAVSKKKVLRHRRGSSFFFSRKWKPATQSAEPGRPRCLVDCNFALFDAIGPRAAKANPDKRVRQARAVCRRWPICAALLGLIFVLFSTMVLLAETGAVFFWSLLAVSPAQQ